MDRLKMLPSEHHTCGDPCCWNLKTIQAHLVTAERGRNNTYTSHGYKTILFFTSTFTKYFVDVCPRQPVIEPSIIQTNWHVSLTLTSSLLTCCVSTCHESLWAALHGSMVNDTPSKSGF